jgi:Na+/H+-dicarboxylate symporter
VLPVAQAMGLPIDPMGLMIAVETVPDVFATLGNVTGDLTATTVVAGAQSELSAGDESAPSHAYAFHARSVGAEDGSVGP